MPHFEDNLDRISDVVKAGAPAEALHFFGRWWQLETYLRELAYIELRARYGIAYGERLGQGPAKRDDKDQQNAYMASADEGDLLAYCDAGELIKVISSDWDLFEPCLVPRNRWDVDAEIM